MKFENINMLNDTMAILDRGYYEVNGKRVNLKLSKAEMKEISVFLPKDVKSISDNKDFQHIHVMGRRIGVGCVNMDSYSRIKGSGRRSLQKEFAFAITGEFSGIRIL